MIAGVRPAHALAALAIVLIALAWFRPIDHDESQYVAAAVLSGHDLLPYRDYAYLQTPLQPLLLAPVAWGAGVAAYPVLRLVNALFATLAVAATWRAMRVAGVDRRAATAAAALFACCDILLFSAGTARNDALPCALLALALPVMLWRERGRWQAALVGLLLAGASAAKLSYALPAIAYGGYALLHRSHRPAWVALGTLPIVALVLATFVASPFGFYFGTLIFPTAAPIEYYTVAGRAWKLAGWVKALDVVKFLALGPALLALGTLMVRRSRMGLLDWLIVAGLIAALLPTPTWRQYLLPVLPPLFVRLALAWHARPPGRGWRIASVVFAMAGLAPTVEALAKGGGMAVAIRDGRALRIAMDAAGVRGPVATLSPQFVPATGRPIDPRFAAGPFYFRSHDLLPVDEETRLHLVSRDRLSGRFAAPPAAIVVGGEGLRSAGDPALDAAMARWAVVNGWRRVTVASGRLALYVPPR